MNGPPRIVETFKLIHRRNPISVHQWTEQGKTTGYDVVGGGWMRSHHRTLKQAEIEVEFRKRHPFNPK